MVALEEVELSLLSLLDAELFSEVELSVMAQDMLTSYKYGWKTVYYQNTYDFKGEEETVQPQGVQDTVQHTELNGQKPREEFESDEEYEEYCDACAI